MNKFYSNLYTGFELCRVVWKMLKKAQDQIALLANNLGA
jgi:hypothetical protein